MYNIIIVLLYIVSKYYPVSAFHSVPSVGWGRIFRLSYYYYFIIFRTILIMRGHHHYDRPIINDNRFILKPIMYNNIMDDSKLLQKQNWEHVGIFWQHIGISAYRIQKLCDKILAGSDYNHCLFFLYDVLSVAR